MTSIREFDTLPSSLSLHCPVLGGAKDEHFSCFLSSCQLGLRQEALAENKESKQCNAVFLRPSCHQQAVSKQAKTLFSKDKGTENLFLTSCVFFSHCRKLEEKCK